MVLLFYLR